MEISDCILEFILDCSGRGLRPRTIESYRWALGRLAAGCASLPPGRGELRGVLAAPGLALVSRRDLWRCLNVFFRWCRTEYAMSNPLEDLRPPARARTLPRVLSTAEVGCLWLAARSQRDRALVALPLDTGVRLGEIAGLTWPHVGLDHLRVSGKTGQRQVPLSVDVREMLDGLGDGHHVWVGRWGPMTLYGLQRTYRRLFALAGIAGPKAGPHVLRHTFATLYLRSGGNIRILQEILGHTTLTTTMVYLHLSGRDVAADHAAHSPMQAGEIANLLRR